MVRAADDKKIEREWKALHQAKEDHASKVHKLETELSSSHREQYDMRVALEEAKQEGAYEKAKNYKCGLRS